MVIPVNNNFSPLPFYVLDGNELDNKYLESNKPYAYGAVFDMPISEGWLMPFQFTVDGEFNAVTSCDVIPISAPSATVSISSSIILIYDNNKDTTTIIFKGEQKGILPLGRAYIRLVLRNTKTSTSASFMSDIFTNIRSAQDNQKKVPSGYIRINYTNDHTLLYGGGQVNFSNVTGGFGFELLIDATICKPVYSYEEKAAERLGYRFIESQVSKKTYSFSFTAPEYLCDALRLLPMCNSRIIKDEWHTYNKITDVNVDVEWLDQGDLAKVTVSFNNDTIMANLAEYISVVPTRLHTTLPIPDPPLTVLPEVVLNSIVQVRPTSFGISAEVTSDGNGTLEERGVCWSNTGVPTILSSHLAHNVTAVGRYRQRITGLSEETTYYVRAYAINSVGVAYSDTMTVTTPTADSAPTVRTYDTNNVMDVYAYLTGEILSEGSHPVTERGFVVVEDASQQQVATVPATPERGEVFIQQVTGLTPSTSYTFRAYAVNEIGTAYGEAKAFRTRAAIAKPPTVVTDANARDVTNDSAVLGGTVTSNGGAAITERGICYMLGSGTPTIGSGLVIVDTGTPNLGTFYLLATGLAGGQLYSFRAYAKNYAGTSYGEVSTFTTDGAIGSPIVIMESCKVGTTTIGMVGSIVSDEGSPVTDRGFVYSVNSDMSNAVTVAASQIDGKVFSKYVENLQPDTTYYVKAYATNAHGTGYSSILELTTYPTPAQYPTVTVDQINPTTSQRNIVFTGEVTDSGGLTVTERGICHAFHNEPTIADLSASAASAGVGEFEVAVPTNKFDPNRRYYYRAYAINALGVAYSDVKYFWDDAIDLGQQQEEQDER